MGDIIRIRRGSASDWTTKNPVLAAGELGLETDTKKLKAGDGSVSWSSLSYVNTTSGTTYVHPITDGNLHVPATGTTSNGKILVAGATAGAFSWQSAASASGGTVTNVTGTLPVNVSTGTSTPVISIDGATASTAGSMSAADKQKLNSVADSANNYTHPTADGSMHVPATSTSNNGKVLTAGSSAGSFAWATPAASATTFAASAVTSGTFDTARLGAGTASTNTYLRGDGWATLPTGSVVNATYTKTSVSSFSNGFSVWSGMTPKSYKDDVGRVWMEGACFATVGSTRGVMFYLPSGQRPNVTRYFLVPTSASVLGSISIGTDGAVTAISGEVTFVGLDGISFRTD